MKKQMSIPAALKGLHSTNLTRRAQALIYLRDQQDDQVLAALVSAMDDPDDGLRADVAFILGLRAAGYDLLVAHLRTDPSAFVRASCAVALTNDWFSPAIEAFMEALEDAADAVVITACNVLGGAGDQRAVTPLRRLFQHSSREVRLCACQSLLRLIGVSEELLSAVRRETRLRPASEPATVEELLAACQSAL